MPLFWRALLRHPWRHPWQLALAVLGIALGVAVVLAVDLANASARRGFDLAMSRITGHATHRLVAARGIPESLYAELRVKHGIRRAAPAVVGYLPNADQPGQLLQIFGVDPFAEAPFRDTAADLTGKSFDIRALLVEPDAALLPVTLGETVRLRCGDQYVTLRRAGTLDAAMLAGLVITDIATAQAVLGRPGQLSHIDLIVPDGLEGERQLAALRNALPPEIRLERPAERNQATADLSAAFSLNLTAMSLLALLVGMFLIYNAMTFSVVQRRSLLGMLRALGVSRQELFLGVLGEALLLGLVGAMVGSLLGIGLGSGLVYLVTRTINDLYYVLSVRELFIDPWSLARALSLGVLATVAAAWLPAREAANAPPGAVLSRAHLESRWRVALPFLVLGGLILLASGAVVLVVLQSLTAGFAGLFLLILGCALLTPPVVVSWVRLNRPLTMRLGLVVQMANRDVARHLSRTGVAVAALMVAFSATVGVGVMVDSFRGGVALWINDLLNADLYIAPPPDENNGEQLTALEPGVLAALRAMPEIAEISTYRGFKVDLENRPVRVIAADLAASSQAGYRLIAGQPDTVWPAFQRGDAVLVSEPLAYRQHRVAGDQLTLPTDSGPRTFNIAGVFLDYGSEHGRVLLHQSVYARYWHEPLVTSVAVFAKPDVRLADLRVRLQQRLGVIQPLVIRHNLEIRRQTLAIFDRTFTITRVLRLLAIVVAIIGVLSALLALQLERAREFAVLRAIGMTASELGGLVSLQTGFMGAMAGLLAIPAGLLSAAVLIFVINRRAFGWSLPFEVNPWLVLETLVLAVMAALLAGLYPIWRMARAQPADALRTT